MAAAGSDGKGPETAVLLGAVLACFAARVASGRAWLIDPDEFQHLHNAYMIHRGQLPYVDYFAHHTPLLHFLYARVFSAVDDPLQVVRVVRATMHAFDLAILVLTFILARSLHSAPVAALSLLVLSVSEYFFTKVIEFRPDGPGTALWLACLVFLVVGAETGRRRVLWWFASGACLGAAILFTQKLLFALPGAAVAILLLSFGAERRPLRWRASATDAFAFVAGWALPIAAIGLIFARLDALGAFVHGNLIANLGWPHSEPRGHSLMRFFAWHPLLTVLGVGGILALLLAALCGAVKDRRTLVPLAGIGALIVGAIVSPSTYRQYYLPLLPLLAVQAAWFLLVLAAPGGVRWSSGGAWLAQRPVWLRAGFLAPGMGVLVWLGLAGLREWHLAGAALLVAAWLATSMRRRQAAVVLVVLGLMAPYAGRMVAGLTPPNAPQLAAIRFVHDNTEPDDAVFDGFSGFGFMRPHAYFYYALTPGTQAIMTPEQLGPELVDALNRTRPPIALLDSATDRLPLVVQSYFMVGYRQVAEIYGVRIMERRDR